MLRPEGPSCYSPGRSEAEAWVLSTRHRVLKGRHKHATFYSTMPIIVKNKAHFLHKMNTLAQGDALELFLFEAFQAIKQIKLFGYLRDITDSLISLA